MIPRSQKSEERDRTTRAAPRSYAENDSLTAPFSRRRLIRLIGEVLRGCVFAGTGLLLGTRPFILGAAPAGIALLAASSSYTWWIAGGAILGAFLYPGALHAWAWVGVYAFLLVLRLCIRLFVDPPSHPDGQPLRTGTYLSLCFSSFRRNIGFSSAEQPDSIPLPSFMTPEMQLFGEHPFLRMLTSAVAGFVAGLFGMLSGGFHVYDLLATLFLLFSCPALTFALVSVFGEAGLTLLFSPTPLEDVSPQNMPLGTPRVRVGRPAGQASLALDGGVTAHYRLLPLLSVLCLFGLAVFSARGRTLLSTFPYLQVNLSFCLALLLSLLTASRLGAVAGMAVSITTGLACSPRLSPVVMLAVGGYVLLRLLSPYIGLLGGCTVGAVWCAAVEGFPVLVIHLPSILLTVPLYLVIERITMALPLTAAPAHTDRELEGFAASVSAALAAENRAEAQRNRLSALSDALSSLSHRFSELSGQLRRPASDDLQKLCDEALAARCAHCRNYDSCHRHELRRLEEVSVVLARALEENGAVRIEDFPEFFFEFCTGAEELVNDIGRRYAILRESLDRCERSDVFAADYAAMAALLGDALDADRAESDATSANRAVADRIYDRLTDRGLCVHGVAVTGREETRRRRVILQLEAPPNTEDETVTTEDIRTLLEEICGASLLPPTVEVVGRTDPVDAVRTDDTEDSRAVVLTFAPRAPLSTAYAGSTVPAGHPRRAPLPAPLTDRTPPNTYTPPAVCGDHIALFRGGEGYFYALISDGMGSGERASVTSEICASFLEKMLAAGGRAELSLRMLDSYLHAKNTGTGDECSATVDLMELDLMDGHAVFAKSGAAPTYVVRDGTVYKLRSRSLPLGILRETTPEFLRFRTDPGDVVVMVSDGVTQGQDECPWLIDLLSSPMPRSMDELRRDIIHRALSSGSEDDLSAIAIRVEK